MVRKRELAPSSTGCPDWMVTYGDMMSLLLCFFVLLVALSEVKQEKFMRVLDSLRRAFGYTEAGQPVPGQQSLTNSPFDQISYVEFIQGRSLSLSEAERRAQMGPFPKVTAIREGERIVIGGRIAFARGGAEVSQEAREALARIAENLRGHPNKVEVRGHASRQPLPAGSPYRDKWDLAYARARAVADLLERSDIPPERMRIVSCGDAEPLQETYETDQQWRNQRVEVLMMEAAADEFVRPAAPGAVSRTPAAASLQRAPAAGVGATPPERLSGRPSGGQNRG